MGLFLWKIMSRRSCHSDFTVTQLHRLPPKTTHYIQIKNVNVTCFKKSYMREKCV